jgi:hypothetical protein
MNGMTSSIGSVSGFQSHEWTGSSTAEKMAISGHTRGSSSDGQLINLGEPGVMKRTQSNSSLSDHSRCSISVFLYRLHSTRECHSMECCMTSILLRFITFYFLMCGTRVLQHGVENHFVSLFTAICRSVGIVHSQTEATELVT